MQRGHKTGLEGRGQRNHGQPIRVTPAKQQAQKQATESWWLGKSREELRAEAEKRFAVTPLGYLVVNMKGHTEDP